MHRPPLPLDIVRLRGSGILEIVEALDAHHIMLRSLQGDERIAPRPGYQSIRLVGVAAPKANRRCSRRENRSV